MTETAVREITGIERLRALGREQEERSWSTVGKVRGRLMLQIADQIERELTEALDGRGEEVTDVATVRADAMEAYGWARERGGLDAVRRALQDAENRRAELCSALDVDAETGWSDAMEEVRTRVRRPAPKVLDADGAGIRVGDSVWDMGGNGPYEVVRFTEHGYVRIKSDFGLEQSAFCERLTHRAPALAADGRPLREGETVWSLINGERFFVMEIDHEHGWPSVSRDGSSKDKFPILNPRKTLTHERPDSWERLEKDATIAPAAYCHDRGLPCACDPDPDAATYVEAMARDLVRRARVLAERGQ